MADLSKATPRPWWIDVQDTAIGHVYHIKPTGAVLYVDNQHLPRDAENEPCKVALATATLMVKSANDHDRLKRAEKLAGELANDIKLAAFPPGHEGDPLHFNSLQIDRLLAKVHELQAEIGKGAA